MFHLFIFPVVSAHFPLNFLFLPLSTPPCFLSFSVCPHSGNKPLFVEEVKSTFWQRDTELHLVGNGQTALCENNRHGQSIGVHGRLNHLFKTTVVNSMKMSIKWHLHMHVNHYQHMRTQLKRVQSEICWNE